MEPSSWLHFEGRSWPWSTSLLEYSCSPSGLQLLLSGPWICFTSSPRSCRPRWHSKFKAFSNGSFTSSHWKPSSYFPWWDRTSWYFFFHPSEHVAIQNIKQQKGLNLLTFYSKLLKMAGVYRVVSVLAEFQALWSRGGRQCLGGVHSCFLQWTLTLLFY